VCTLDFFFSYFSQSVQKMWSSLPLTIGFFN
jgi:hypothetical protein